MPVYTFSVAKMFGIFYTDYANHNDVFREKSKWLENWRGDRGFVKFGF